MGGGASKSVNLTPRTTDLDDGRLVFAPGAHDVFLSHTSSDGKAMAQEVAEDLRGKHVVSFLDRECLGHLEELESCLRASTVVIFFISSEVFKSVWCCVEVAKAVELGLEIVPVIVKVRL